MKRDLVCFTSCLLSDFFILDPTCLQTNQCLSTFCELWHDEMRGRCAMWNGYLYNVYMLKIHNKQVILSVTMYVPWLSCLSSIVMPLFLLHLEPLTPLDKLERVQRYCVFLQIYLQLQKLRRYCLNIVILYYQVSELNTKEKVAFLWFVKNKRVSNRTILYLDPSPSHLSPPHLSPPFLPNIKYKEK